MVGDSVEKDVWGARNAGLQAVWLNRGERPVPEDLDAPHISTLSELLEVLAHHSLR